MNRQTAMGRLNDTISGEGSGEEERQRRTKSNNSLNRSANSVAFIENLSVMALCARPVNSSVMSPLRMNSMMSPAAPQLNDVDLVWIMREVG
jgi:hypothetical protein